MTADAPDGQNADSQHADIKAKMREALERKQSNDNGVSRRGHGKEKAPGTHGPVGGKREFRRKSG